MKKLNAFADKMPDGKWSVYVEEVETGKSYDLIIEADTEKDAAFKAMEQINEQ